MNQPPSSPAALDTPTALRIRAMILPAGGVVPLAAQLGISVPALVGACVGARLKPETLAAIAQNMPAERLPKPVIGGPAPKIGV